MNDLTKQEKIFIEHLIEPDTNIPNLMLRMKIPIYLCYSLWIIMPAIAWNELLLRGLQIYLALGISSAICMRCKNILKKYYLVKELENVY